MNSKNHRIKHYAFLLSMGVSISHAADPDATGAISSAIGATLTAAVPEFKAPEVTVDRSQRFFHIDNESPKTIHQQIRQQWIDFMKSRLSFFETQRDYIQYILAIKKKTGKGLVEIDPIFSGPGVADEVMIGRLEGTIPRANLNIENTHEEITKWGSYPEV